MKHNFILFMLFMHSLIMYAHTHIRVIIPSFNNASCVHKNLDSVFAQQYPVFDVMYIDDASTDGTGALVRSYITAHPDIADRLRLIENPFNQKAMANIYNAVHECNDNDLVVILDGDDALAHTNVLSTIERTQREKNAWISYAQYMNVPEKNALALGLSVRGYAKASTPDVIKEKKYRSSGWRWTGLRSFYAWIFKQIKLEDLMAPIHISSGRCVPTACDNAYFFPLLEMAGNHCAFIDEILLLRNVATPLNDFKINRTNQTQVSRHIRAQKTYPTLPGPIEHTQTSYSFSFVLYNTDQAQLEHTCKAATRAFADARHIYIISDEKLAGPLEKCIVLSPSEAAATFAHETEYLIVCSTGRQAIQSVDIIPCLDLMQQTKAQRFYLSHNAHIFKGHTPTDIPVHTFWHGYLACRSDLFTRYYKAISFDQHVFIISTRQLAKTLHASQHTTIDQWHHLTTHLGADAQLQLLFDAPTQGTLS